MVVSAAFFKRSTVELARELLGTILVHETTEGTTSGKIVETEAYLFRDDPACHAARGKTARNAPMFGPAGTCYVYLIYGMHLCFNVVSGIKDEGEAVLIRALEPVDGIALMRKRRGVENERLLCNGPAKLVQAMGIKRDQNEACLRTGALRLLPPEALGRSKSSKQVVQTTRIGISSGQDLALRFYLKGSAFISKA